MIQLESSPQMRGPLDVILVDRVLGFYYHRRPNCRLVCRSCWSACWGLALGGIAALIATVVGAFTLRNAQPATTERT